MVGGQIITKLFGNVLIVHEGTELSSDRAFYFRQQRKIELMDNVKVVKDDKVITARQVFYFIREKRVEAEGDILFTEGRERTSRCRKLTYYTDTERTIARDDIVINEQANKYVISGGYGEYTEGKRYGYLVKSPVLIRLDDERREVFRVTSRKMEVFADSSRVIMHDSVAIEKEAYQATCARAGFDEGTERLLLVGAPVIWSDEHVLSGDTIAIFLKDFAMQRMIVTGNAREQAYVTSDSGLSGQVESELTGKRITVYFREERIDTAYIEKNAVNVYYEYDKAGNVKGRNEVSGHTITLVWEDDELRRAQVTGGAQGGYYPGKHE